MLHCVLFLMTIDRHIASEQEEKMKQKKSEKHKNLPRKIKKKRAQLGVLTCAISWNK